MARIAKAIENNRKSGQQLFSLSLTDRERLSISATVKNLGRERVS
jgi:hypothetical protein